MKTRRYKPRLVKIDLTKGEGNNHPDIKTDGTNYLVRHRGTLHIGPFSKQWYGLNFDGWRHNPCGVQYDKPGTNASGFEQMWEIKE